MGRQASREAHQWAEIGGTVVSDGNERAWGTLAHLSIFVNIFTVVLGPLVSFVIWLVYQDRSREISFQALQSMWYQIAWGVLLAAGWAVARVLYAGRFDGKQNPVHLYWHSLDLAITRFSGKRAELPEDVDPVTREAYSHEVISCGFWVGDRNVREPAFYSYTAPEPAGLTDQPLRPESASWQEGGTALLPYEAVRNSASPKDTLLEFMQSAYESGAATADWYMQDFSTQMNR